MSTSHELSGERIVTPTAPPPWAVPPLVAPVIMTPRMIGAATVSGKSRGSVGGGSSTVDFATLGRAPLRLGFGSRRVTSRDLQIVEATEELLGEEVPEPDVVAQNVSLLRGFNATIPSAEKSRIRRRQTRNVDTPKLGLKRMSLGARGMLGDDEDHDGESVASEDDVVMVGRSERTQRGRKVKAKRKGRQSLSASKHFGAEELIRQTLEIERDKENIYVRRVRALHLSVPEPQPNIGSLQTLINNEIEEISRKIEALDAIRAKLEQDLLKLQEEELELDDECTFFFCACLGITSQMMFVCSRRRSRTSRARGVRKSTCQKPLAFSSLATKLKKTERSCVPAIRTRRVAPRGCFHGKVSSCLGLRMTSFPVPSLWRATRHLSPPSTSQNLTAPL